MGLIFSDPSKEQQQLFFQMNQRQKNYSNPKANHQQVRPTVVVPPKKVNPPPPRPYVGSTRRNISFNGPQHKKIQNPSNQPNVKEQLKKINFQQHTHQQIWPQFEDAVKKCFKFNLLTPVATNEEGKKLLKDGTFLTCWLRAVFKNPYVNSDLLLKETYKNYFGGIETDKELFETFYNQKAIKNAKAEQSKDATPIKPTQSLADGSKLKRSILKNSSRKVQFGSDKIIYPVLDDFNKQNIFSKKMPPTIEERKGKCYTKNVFVIDYFEINDIYLLEQVEIIGLVKEYNGKYGVFLVRDKIQDKEITCIGVHVKNDEQQVHQVSVLRDFEKEFFITGFLDLEGREIGEAWVDSLPTDSLKK